MYIYVYVYLSSVPSSELESSMLEKEKLEGLEAPGTRYYNHKSEWGHVMCVLWGKGEADQKAQRRWTVLQYWGNNGEQNNWKEKVNKLELSCAKLRFSCAGQLSFDGRELNSVSWTLEPVQPIKDLEPMQHLNQFNTWTNSMLEPIQYLKKFNPWTNSTLETITPLKQFNPWTNSTLEQIQPLNQFNPWTNDLFKTLNQLNHLNPCSLNQLNLWTNDILETLNQLNRLNSWTLEPIEPLN